MTADDMLAETAHAATLIAPEPKMPRPGDPCLYRGGEIIWVERPEESIYYSKGPSHERL